MRRKIPIDNEQLLTQALTHRSATPDASGSNERLEFFGDAVLGMVVAEYLCREHPDWDQGQLSKAKAAAVQEPTLADAALALGLDEMVIVGPGERSVGRRLPSVLSDAFEAVIGAVYLDQGLEGARSFIIESLGHSLDAIARGEPVLNDSKSRLQELSQAHWKTTPDYRTITSSGAPHDPSFTVEVVVNGEVMGQGTGRSKKEAEQAAAEQAIEELTERGVGL